jgi:hypothetical protein
VHYSTLDRPIDAINRSHTCPRCGTIDTPTLSPGAGLHAFRVLCNHCGAFIQWISQYSPAERQARRQQDRAAAIARKPPSPMQLGYLRSLGDTAPLPATMLEASQRIDALTRKGRVAL